MAPGGYNPNSFGGFATMEDMLAHRAKMAAEEANLKAAWERVRAGYPPVNTAAPAQWRTLDQVAQPDYSKTFAGMSEADYAPLAKKHMQPSRGKK